MRTSPDPAGEICAELIGAIGAPDFAAAAAGALRRTLGFELAAVFVHRDHGAVALFEDFAAAGYGDGLDAYASVTHRMNPMLRRGPGVARARDFAAAPRIAPPLRPYVTAAPDEELGFRTLGWPPGLEEIGLYFPACGGVVELGLYRPRARRTADVEARLLSTLYRPLAAAFARHHALTAPAFADDRLSPREQEVCRLLLAGCSTEAVALRLGLSGHTVKDHRKQIFRKLAVGSVQELFALDRRRAASPALEG